MPGSTTFNPFTQKLDITGLASSVVGPSSSTDNAVARFDGTGGATIQNSVVLIDDAGATSGITSLLVNATAAKTLLGLTPILQVEGTTYSTSSGSFIANNPNGSIFPLLLLGRSNGATQGSNTIVASGDFLGGINFTGADGVQQIQGTAIVGRVDGTPGVNDMPGRLELQTTPDGSPTLATRVVISSDGTVSLGTTKGATTGALNAGVIACNNPVTAGVAVSSTHKVAISIGGVTYYLLASNV